MILSLFIFSKLNAYEAQIYPKYSKTFGIIKLILSPILKGLGAFLKPFKIGNGLFLDVTQFVLLILLLLILIQ